MSNDIPAEDIEMTEQDQADLARLLSEGGELPSFHTVLEVWREVLKPAAAEATKKVTPAWANRIVTSYQEVRYADMEHFRDSYFGKIGELAAILDHEISTDADCLTYTTPEEDAAENAHHYKNLLLYWQLAVLQWELDWETTAPWAPVEVAAISEVHKMFFGQTGITAYLDNIRFEFTEADQQQLAEALEQLRDEEAR